MHLNHYDYDTVVILNDGKKTVKAEITASTAPSSFPETGEGMTGKFPTKNPADTSFQPGSSILAPKTGQVWILDADGDWDEV